MCAVSGDSPAKRKTNGIRTLLKGASRHAKRKLLVEIRKLEAVVKNEPADRLAADLQDLLLKHWSTAQKAAIEDAIRSLASGATFTQKDLDELTSKLDTILGQSYAQAVEEDLKEIDRKAYGLGLTGTISANLTFSMVDVKAVKWLDEFNLYWVREHYDRQLREDVTRLGKQVLESGMTKRDAADLFEAELGERMDVKSWRYWQGFANTVVTRSREFGAVERYVTAGVESLQVKAILDHRTTEICRTMHNRIIPVANAVETRNKMMAAETPEEVIKAAPWMKPSEVADKPSKSLPTGMSLPPYHYGNCRTRTVAYTQTDSIVEGRKSGKNMKQPAQLQALSDIEYSEWIRDIQQRKSFGYDPDLLERHMGNHAADFGLGIDEADQYKKLGRDIVKNSDSVFARIYQHKEGHSQMQFVFFGKVGQAVVGDDNMLHGVFAHRKKSAWKKAFENQRDSGLWLELTNKN